jgi:hypothetical protein
MVTRNRPHWFPLVEWIFTIKLRLGDVWPQAELGAASTVSPHWFPLVEWIFTIKLRLGDVWPQAELGAASTVSPH